MKMMCLVPKPSHLDYVFPISHALGIIIQIMYFLYPMLTRERKNPRLCSQRENQNMVYLKSVTASFYIHDYLWLLVSCIPDRLGNLISASFCSNLHWSLPQESCSWSMHFDDTLPLFTSDVAYCNRLEGKQGWFLARSFCLTLPPPLGRILQIVPYRRS